MKPLEKNHSSTTTPEPEPVSTAESGMFSDDIDSSCSTPYVSAPSSPGRNQPHSGFYYSAPASPMHFVLTTVSVKNAANTTSIISSPSEDFDFSARLTGDGDGGDGDGSMSSADELFLNGKIRPMKLSTHLKRPQVLAPLLDLDENEDEDEKLGFRGRDNLKLRDRSLRRRTRSMSPLRTTSYEWQEEYEEEEELQVVVKEKNEEIIIKQDDEVENEASNETTPCPSGSSSRSSSVGRSSKRWVFLKEFLYRSKSEGRNNTHKFWSGISFSPVKEKKLEKIATPKGKQNGNNNNTKEGKKKFVNGSGIGKRRVPPSPHELHYTTNRAQSEEMRKKTFLPYRQGLLGCLGFSSKSYGAMNGFARALNPVSSR
ncbi:uncharacterized protein LOC132064342 [Lycium ferocissimum]|uniref:uncharacterized protein LOC132064342 n=1 Tax=Lycium ferocissimum TaxID=112874 RepID=UPI0028155E75|nr:uncharacterized protein LOC132064342 [Lycium ferocissimum]